MIRSLAVFALIFAVCPQADAQIIIRTSPRPAGVIQPPSLPLPGSPLQHMTVAPPRNTLRPVVVANPYYNSWGFAPYYPWYEGRPQTTIVNNVTLPAPQPIPVAPPPPPELRARLTLNLPAGSKVWLAGKEMDAAIAPLILESPVLKEGQTYSFDVKVTWLEGRTTEERTRLVAVDAGEMKSLTYFGAR